MNLTQYQLDRIKDDHSKGRKLPRLAITKLFRELDIAKEDVRGIELKIDAKIAEIVSLQAEIAFLKGQIAGYKMRYENTGSMFGRREQAATIEENKRLREALQESLNIIAIQPLDTVMKNLLDITIRALEGTK